MKSEKDPREDFIQPSTFKDIAVLYNVSYKTLLAWVKPFRAEIGIQRGRCLTIPQVKIVFAKLDLPPGFAIDKSSRK